MRLSKIYRQLLTICALLSVIAARAQNWNQTYNIGTASGVVCYSAQQTPSQLVELQQAAYPTTGITYQWESSTTASFDVASVIGTGTTYTFSAPLTQTMYYRRKATYSTNNYIYSNTIKIQLVSAYWEDRNYVREHTVRISGVTTWQAVDALAIGDKLQTTSYMDGLGRSVQQISKGTATPATTGGQWGDMVQFSIYDAASGLEPKKYLPYTTTTEAGKFKSDPATGQGQYYTATYSETSPYGPNTI